MYWTSLFSKAIHSCFLICVIKTFPSDIKIPTVEITLSFLEILITKYFLILNTVPNFFTHFFALELSLSGR